MLFSFPISDSFDFLSCDFSTSISVLHAEMASNLVPLALRMDSLFGRPPEKISFGQDSFLSLLRLMLKGTLHSQIPAEDFEAPIEAFYSRAFRAFYKRQEAAVMASEDDEDDACGDLLLECDGCKRERDSCKCNEILAEFHDVNRKLVEMDLLERMTSNAITRIIHSRYTRVICVFAKHVYEPLYSKGSSPTSKRPARAVSRYPTSSPWRPGWTPSS